VQEVQLSAEESQVRQFEEHSKKKYFEIMIEKCNIIARNQQ